MKILCFVENRKRLLEYMEENSVLLLFAGEAPIKRGDEKYPFSPDRNFYYTTGIEREHGVFMLSKQNGRIQEILFIPRENGEMAKWVGANLSKKETYEQSGVEDIRFLDEMEETLSVFLFKNEIQIVYLDLERREWSASLSPSACFAIEFQKRFPAILLQNAYPIFCLLREIKQPWELERIRKAISITAQAIQEMMRHAKPGMYEYEIEAYFDFVLKKNGVKEKAFQTIAASGKNGTILHYIQNDRKTEETDLILFDVGAQVDWYNGDLTRTFPVSGKFTKRQKEIYEIVLQGQQKVIDAIKPGVLFSSLNEILREHYFEKLKEIGLIQKKEEVNRYYYHNVSHFLGAETHDAGRYQNKVLQPGMVLTVEPGLYLKEEGIGIRIEDDILVTETGKEVLSEGLIKKVEEIEAFMKEDFKE